MMENNRFSGGYKNVLINKIFKLIPLRQDKKEWMSHLDNVLLELHGLQQQYPSINLYEIRSKMSVLKFLSWKYYKNTIFECLNLLEKMDFPEEGD